MRREQEKARLEELHERKMQAYCRIQDYDSKQGATTSYASTTPPSNISTSMRSAEPLILDGPKRGFVLIDDTFIEIDLKIKDIRWKGLQQQRDRELSKGFVSIRSIRTLEKCKVESKFLATRLSTVE
ncbi:hypothetical protein BAE44_0017912 [Dichanthelium oligosanthes]|uniref:DUF6598 domain-containing protein n=1 Tax=Dichanthelium oligosanthes TaxID=888268 RepID=A0A1E5V7C5_9POAL|nr:hypothetical protein BAE44_0017912 [Dichanthelium oligosanthes]